MTKIRKTKKTSESNRKLPKTSETVGNPDRDSNPSEEFKSSPRMSTSKKATNEEESPTLTKEHHDDQGSY